MNIQQDVARSSYADMLHDDERNHIYFAAIRVAVHHLVESNKSTTGVGNRHFKCCDIGTGSGLLSMMIVEAFREVQYGNYEIAAYEAFKPMADCARKVIETNGMSEHITVIPSRLEELKAKDSPMFDLVVAELLDTELIGEGCLQTYRYAVENLCSSECIFIPKEARIYIQPISSNYLYSRQAIGDINCNLNTRTFTVDVPRDVKDCCGMPEIDDLQVHNINDIIELADPAIAFHIEFDNIESLKLKDHAKLMFKLKNSITSVPMIIMWWDIIMVKESLYRQYHDTSNTPMSFLTLSCAPSWIRNSKSYPDHYYRDRDSYITNLYRRKVWREHWIRGIYHFGSVLKTRALVGSDQEDLSVYAYHDSHSLWFDVEPSDSKLPKSCSCGVHRLLSRSDLSFLNGTNGDLDRFLIASSAEIGQDTCHHLRGKIYFNTGAEVVGLNHPKIQNSEHKWMIQVTAEDRDLFGLIDFSLQDEICWQKILRRSLEGLSIHPIASFEILCLHVVFEELSRIRDKVVSCEGFDLEPLDRMIGDSMKYADESVEPIFLWEYDSRCVGEIIQILSVSADLPPQSSCKRNFTLSTTKEVGQGLVFWTNLVLVDGTNISTGPINDIQSDDKRINWNRNYRQLVHFIQDAASSVEVEDTTRYCATSVSVELDINELKVETRSSLNYS